MALVFPNSCETVLTPLHTNGGHAKGERPACVIPVSGSALGNGGPGEGERPGD